MVTRWWVPHPWGREGPSTSPRATRKPESSSSKPSGSRQKRKVSTSSSSRATKRDKRRRQKALDKQVPRAEKEQENQGARPSPSLARIQPPCQEIAELVSPQDFLDQLRGSPRGDVSMSPSLSTRELGDFPEDPFKSITLYSGIRTRLHPDLLPRPLLHLQLQD